MKIEELHLSLRAYNCLKRTGIHTVEQLRVLTDEELMRIRGFGIGCLTEVRRLIQTVPAIPGPSALDPNMAELCFRNGEAHMKEKVIAMLMDQQTCADGICHKRIADTIRMVEVR